LESSKKSPREPFQRLYKLKGSSFSNSIPKKKSFQCLQCLKSFEFSCHIRKHMIIHSKERPFKCIQCSKSFKHSSNLKNHLRIHKEEKPLKCLQCPKSFSYSSESELKEHLKIHPEENPFKCLHCSESFNQSSHLNQHILIHTEEKPLTDEHEKNLNTLFNRNPYPSKVFKILLGQEIGLNYKQIDQWFGNRRKTLAGRPKTIIGQFQSATQR
jgi:uncharacterized Zn-finger protein